MIVTLKEGRIVAFFKRNCRFHQVKDYNEDKHTRIICLDIRMQNESVVDEKLQGPFFVAVIFPIKNVATQLICLARRMNMMIKDMIHRHPLICCTCMMHSMIV